LIRWCNIEDSFIKKIFDTIIFKLLSVFGLKFCLFSSFFKLFNSFNTVIKNKYQKVFVYIANTICNRFSTNNLCVFVFVIILVFIFINKNSEQLKNET